MADSFNTMRDGLGGEKGLVQKE